MLSFKQADLVGLRRCGHFEKGEPYHHAIWGKLAGGLADWPPKTNI